MKKCVTLIICAVLALLLITACDETLVIPENVAQGSPVSKYQKITAEDGKKLLESGAMLTLVDVRRADEYETAHIPGAVNVPNESIESTQPDALPELNGTVVVYCRTGVRSKQAADKLLKMGYTDVRDMGGIVDWSYDTVSGTDPGEYYRTDSEIDTASAGIMGNFLTKDVDGNDINQSIFKEYDLTMVNVWATYCGPCLSEMPDLGELDDEYRSKGVSIVGIVSDVLNSDGTVDEGQVDTVHSIIEKTGADYLHIVPSKDLYGLMSRITAVPTTFFVDSSGTQIGTSYIGGKSKAEWKDIIEQKLKEAQK